MNNKHRQHWQEDSNDYTHSQYAFYLGLLGILIVGLLLGYIYLVQPPVVPVTRVVSIISRPGGDLPLVPYQHEDATALEAAFGELCQRYEFDDIASLRSVMEQLVESSQQNYQAEDCLLLRLSGIGRLDEQRRPVILGSEPNESLLLQELTDSLKDVQAANIVLILDCGHAYVDESAYQGSVTADDDFNPFAAVVRDAPPEGDPRLKIVLHALPGERPMYSIAQRRSLLGSALESVLARQENGRPVVWDTPQFASALDQICLERGGTGAPSITLVSAATSADQESEPAVVYGIRDLRIEETDPDEEQDPAVTKDDDKVAWDPRANTLGQRADAAWERYIEVQQRLPKMPAVLLFPDRWQELTLATIALSADQLQSAADPDQLQQDLNEASGALVDRYDGLESDLRPGDSLINRLGLTPPADKEPAESPSQRRKREIAEAYLGVHELRFRLPYYVAVADELAWILPANGRVTTIVSETRELLEEYAKVNQPGQAVSIFTDPQPSLDEYDDILGGAKNLLNFELDVRKSLSRFCQNELPGIAGMARAMAVDALLRFPGLEIETPPDDPDVTLDPNRLLSREELMELLRERPSNFNLRVPPGERQQMAAARIELYRALRTCLGEPVEPPASTRRLQRTAYRFGPSIFDWRQVAIRDAAPVPDVRVTNRDDLESRPHYIDLDGTELPMGLKVANVEVDVICELIQAEDYFGFSPASSTHQQTFRGNPTLVANQESPEVDPQCRLQVSVVNRADPDQVFSTFAVPIRLPLPNSLNAEITVTGDRRSVLEVDQVPPPIRPFANRSDVNLEIELRNSWHRQRTGQVLLYACALPDARTVPGRINPEVKSKTQIALDQDKLTLIARAELDLPPAFLSASAQPLMWLPPQEDQEATEVSADHGCLMVVQQDQISEDWYYWIPIFPVEEPVVSVMPLMESGDLKLQIERQQNCPVGGVALKWYFTDELLPGGEVVLGSDEDRRVIPVARNVLERLNNERPYLYVDVDRWPRKYVFQFDGQRFPAAMTRNAAVDLELDSAEGAQPSELIELSPNADWDHRLATRSQRRDVVLTLKPNVPAIGEEFLFARAQDHLRLFKVGDPYRLYYPRAIQHGIQLVPKTGKLFLRSQVSDHRLPFQNVERLFQVQPSVVLGGQAQPLAGANRVQLTFDTQDPVIEDLRVLTSGSIYPDQLVQVRLTAADGDGVGIDPETGVQLFLSPRNGSLQSLEKPIPSKRGQSPGAYEFNAPAEVGTYTLGVRVLDRVGNNDEKLFGNNVKFEVVAKPTPAEQEAMKPKPVKHQLVVQVAIDGGPSITTPELKIAPPGAEPEDLGNNRFLFRNLDAGKRYTVTATSELASGIDKGAALIGSTSILYPKSLLKPLTETKTIKLRRK